jgi:hypothetical protein
MLAIQPSSHRIGTRRLTIVSHCLEIQTHQVGQQKGVALRIPSAISYVKGIRRVCAAPRSREP